MKEESKQGLTFTIIATFILLLLVVALTYAFFTADISNSEGLNVTADFYDDIYPVFTVVPSNDLQLNVSSTDMVKELANTFKSSYQTINISFISETAVETTCEFNFMWTDTGEDSYVPTPEALANNLNEYTIKITDNNGNTIFPETSVYNLTSGNTLLNVPQTISSSGTENTKIYTVTATIYNLDMEQTIYNKNYSSRVTVTDIIC